MQQHFGGMQRNKEKKVMGNGKKCKKLLYNRNGESFQQKLGKAGDLLHCQNN